MEPVYAIREPAVAGRFYPGSAAALMQALDEFLGSPEKATRRPSALVIPHAGYIYSGPVAAAAYRMLGEHSWPRVVLLGPPHYFAVTDIAAPQAAAFATPLGEMAVDMKAIDGLERDLKVTRDDAPHRQEHSLEVHLPFLQRMLGEVKLIPLLVGQASPQRVADILAYLDDGQTLFVISTDLSHFHPYADACQRDQETLSQMIAGHTGLNGEQACGCRAINGLNHYANAQGWQRQQVAYQNSGDTAGDRNRVVGYGSMVYFSN